MERLDLANGVVAHHLQTLERNGLVKRRRVGTRVRFFPAETPIHQVEWIGEHQAAVLHVIQEHPEIQQAALAQMLGLTRQALQHHLKRLRDLGLVAHTRRGRTNRLRVPDDVRQRLSWCAGCQHTLVWRRSSSGQGVCPVCRSDIAI